MIDGQARKYMWKCALKIYSTDVHTFMKCTIRYALSI